MKDNDDAASSNDGSKSSVTAEDEIIADNNNAVDRLNQEINEMKDIEKEQRNVQEKSPVEDNQNEIEMQDIHITSESESDADLEFYDKLKKMKDSSLLKKGDKSKIEMKVEFSDFLEPKLIYTGHIIPLDSGHNGPFGKVALSIYELHLTKAGFIM